MFNAMINGNVDIISNSWAYCEDQTSQADATSIDSILQSAAASGISVFNGSGDNGSSCLDGAANTVAVPADAPSATAVGGSSLTVGPGASWGSETWWNGTNDTPQTGQGGFGTSRYFARPPTRQTES
jgi:kumamolisin